MTDLLIPRHAYDVICADAVERLPRESCGLLIGLGRDVITVDQAVISKNLADGVDRFLIDPQLQFDWMRKLRGHSLRVVGHFHSHPNGVCEPSANDLEMAIDPDLIWVIAAVAESRVAEVKAFQLFTPGPRFVPINLRLIEHEVPATAAD